MNDQQPKPSPSAVGQGQMSPARAYARWLALTWGERRLLLGLMLGLLVVAAMLRVLGVFRTRRWLERFSNHAAFRVADSDGLRAAERLAELAAIAGRRGAITVTCLRQSLLVYWLLRRRGFAPDLKIGMRSLDGVVDGHAWVELGGVALNQPNLTHVAFIEKKVT